MPELPTADRPPTGSQATDATQPLPAATFEVPPELVGHPRYTVVGELGRGGMGVVYKAEHRLMGRPVALKVVQPEKLGDTAARERFLGEIRTAGRLEHENIVRAYEAEPAGRIYVLAMEYIDGFCLATALEGGGRLPVATACEYARQAALGLQYMHEHGLVHRDIKPHNLMVTRRGTVKILDVGLARSSAEGDTRVTETGVCIGTPDYIAPEQALDTRSADIRADIYSLGCTLYHMLSGRAPFRGASALNVVTARLNADAVPLHVSAPGIPAGLSDVVGTMMARDAADRYQTPAEVAGALAPYCRGEAIQATGRTIRSAETVVTAPPPAQQLAARPPRRNGRRDIVRGAALRVGAVVLLVLLASGLFWPSAAKLPPVPPPAAGPPELLANPGCEVPLANNKIPGWVEVQGTWGARYGDPASYEGAAYFSPDPAPVAELRQDVAVDAHAAEIDAGRRAFAFAGQVRSSGQRVGRADASRVVVEFRDAANAAVLTSFDSGDVTSPGGWKAVADRRKAPAGTRWLRIRLISTRHGFGSSNDGYYDALSLKSASE